MRKAIAITAGDPAGIGPEIVVKAFLERPDLVRDCFIVGNVKIIREAAAIVAQGGIQAPTARINAPADALDLPAGCLPVLEAATFPGTVHKGHLSAAAGRFAGDCVVAASRLALAGEVAAIVTGPLNKEALSLAGLPYSVFPGHTELLQAEAAKWSGVSLEGMPVRMMLANRELRVVLVSIHVSMRDAIAAVTLDNVLRTIRIAHQSLEPMLRRKPRIAVAGLNPHAGEGGMFGAEEIDIIGPAIVAAQQSGIHVTGPFAPDTVFMRARSTAQKAGEFDVVVAMHHDQGLIPVKYLGLEHGVNVTLGLPFVRTSPDHGTAFDLAGTGRASAASFIAALELASELAGLG